MELSTLKTLFFVGAKADIDAFCENLRPRCIKSTEKTMTVNGVVNHLIYNTENEHYIAPDMSQYLEDKWSKTLEPVDSFVTVAINRMQQHNTGARTRYIREETISHNSLETEKYLVPNYSDDGRTYLYRDNIITTMLVRNNGTHFWLNQYEISSDSYADDFWLPHTFNEEGYVDDEDAPDTRTYYQAGLLQEVHTRYAGRSFVKKDWYEEHADWFAECSHCHKLWFKSQLRDGKCPECDDFKIWNYHEWEHSHEYVFQHAEGEEVGDTTAYFGTEVETCGPRDNIRFVAPYQDIWHCECDGSLDAGRSFEMVSAPMTWKYVEEHFEDFQTMFNDLSNNGQKGHDANCAGLHVHVSKHAFKNERAVLRAVAIVHGMSKNMQIFSRRGPQSGSNVTNDTYYRYYPLFQYGDENPTWETIKNIPDDGHNCAVNAHLSHGWGYRDTVEFRIFRSTLNPYTYMATVQFVKNIVDLANSDKEVVTWNDLIQGDWITEYLSEQSKYSRNFDLDAKMDFRMLDADELWKNFLNGEHTAVDVQQFTTQLNRLFDISSEQEGGAE